MSTNPFENLEKLKLKNAINISIGYLNINSIYNKFNIMDFLKTNIDILIFSETKIDNSYPSSQFIINGYKAPFRIDISKHSGGILVYIKEDIIAKPLKCTLTKDLQIIPIELNLRKQKWILIPVYRPERTHEVTFLNSITKILQKHSKLNNIIIIGDMNFRSIDMTVRSFIDKFELYNLIKEPTCFKAKNNPSCIDWILTNKKYSF